MATVLPNGSIDTGMTRAEREIILTMAIRSGIGSEIQLNKVLFSIVDAERDIGSTSVQYSSKTFSIPDNKGFTLQGLNYYLQNNAKDFTTMVSPTGGGTILDSESLLRNLSGSNNPKIIFSGLPISNALYPHSGRKRHRSKDCAAVLNTGTRRVVNYWGQVDYGDSLYFVLCHVQGKHLPTSIVTELGSDMVTNSKYVDNKDTYFPVMLPLSFKDVYTPSEFQLKLNKMGFPETVQQSPIPFFVGKSMSTFSLPLDNQKNIPFDYHLCDEKNIGAIDVNFFQRFGFLDSLLVKYDANSPQPAPQNFSKATKTSPSNGKVGDDIPTDEETVNFRGMESYES